ncbi:MAG: glycosyltransferase family 87 protein [Acidimicrobiia bacterium]
MTLSAEDERRSDVWRWRLRWYPRAVIAALGVALFAAVLLGSGASTVSGRLGGDYAAFYGAGRIAVESDWQNMYEPGRQIDAQQDLHLGAPESQYLHFSYPPYVAAAYAPLALLPFRASYLVHSLIMVAAVAGSVWLAGSRIPVLQRYRTLAVALALLFYPMLRAVLGGQNTALTLFLLVGSWRLATDRRDFYSGVVLALLLFKPQYAVPMILLYLLAGRWRVVVGSVVGALALYLVGASLMGADWIVPWTNQAREFAEIDSAVNGANSISFIGFVSNLSGTTQVVLLFGLLPAVAVVGLLALVWLRGRRDALTEKTALAATGLILISPHTMYYDGSLILFTLVVLGITKPSNVKGVAFVWVAAWSQVLAGYLGWSPLFFVVLGVALCAGASLGGPLLDSRRLRATAP